MDGCFGICLSVPIAFPKAKFPALAIFSACVCNSACVGPVRNHFVGFLMMRLKCHFSYACKILLKAFQKLDVVQGSSSVVDICH